MRRLSGGSPLKEISNGKEHSLCFPTNLGTICLKESSGHVYSLCFSSQDAENIATEPSPVLREAKAQLQAYFQGRLQEFTLPIAPEGTVFQRSVWDVLGTVAYGELCSYGEIAEKLGSAKAVRAVATACGKNPLLLLIPCHRIIGKDGSLRGYSGELWRKQFLLDWEQDNTISNK